MTLPLAKVPGNGHCTPGTQSRRCNIDHTPDDSITQWKKNVIGIVLLMALMRKNSTAGYFFVILSSMKYLIKLTFVSHCGCCSPGSSLCSSRHYQYSSPESRCWSLCRSSLDSVHHTASRALDQEWLPVHRGDGIFGLFIWDYSFISAVAARHLQPVVRTVWTLLGDDALDLKAVAEVQRDGEAGRYRNEVLTGQSLVFWIRVSWTGQVPFGFTK